MNTEILSQERNEGRIMDYLFLNGETGFSFWHLKPLSTYEIETVQFLN